MDKDSIYDIEQLKEKAEKKFKENKVFFAKLKKKKNLKLDIIVQRLHEEVFEDIDCLKCANCCSSISPIVIDKDIERLSKHFRTKPAKLIEEYFYFDEDEDYVFKQTPCPFLMEDNYCMVYESRGTNPGDRKPLCTCCFKSHEWWEI